MKIETIGAATLYCGDCREILPTLGTVDAIVTDPPYGIGEAAGKNKSRGNLGIAKDYGNDNWDKEPPDDSVFDLIRMKSRNQIIFGGNYFQLPPSSCWLVWDKDNGGSDFADAELAWTNLNKAVRLKKWRWNGMLQENMKDKEIREHPTQKPVPIMKWCISHLPIKDGLMRICDPYMGSGTTGIAAVQMGFSFIGIEQLEKYFDIACRRIEQAQKQQDLFGYVS